MNQQYWPQQGGMQQPPGLGKPILIGAAAGIAFYAVFGWFFALAFQSPCCCMTPIGGLAAGVLGTLMAQRQEPFMGVGAAFIPGFLAAGITGLVGGAVLALFLETPPELERVVMDSLRQAEQDGAKMTAEDKEVAVGVVKTIFHFFPVLEAITSLALGAIGALITAVIVAGRRQPPQQPQQLY